MNASTGRKRQQHVKYPSLFLQRDSKEKKTFAFPGRVYLPRRFGGTSTAQYLNVLMPAEGLAALLSTLVV